MMLTLHTETVIDSCHRLVGYEGNCNNLHGHTWFLDVWIMGDSSLKDEVGILFDFGKVKEIKEMFDHKYINDLPQLSGVNPTAENISEFIYNYLKQEDPNLMFKIRLYETKVGKETWCELGDF